MRKGSAAFLLLFLLMLLSGCTTTASDDADRIERPSNNAMLLEGTWKIDAYVGGANTASVQIDSEDSIIGEKMGFSSLIMVFRGNYWNDVSFKVKRVNVKEYFLHTNYNTENGLKVNGDETLVLTAYSQDKFLYEFVKISDDTMVVSIDDQYYSMKKVSDKFSGIGDASAGLLTLPAEEDIAAKSQIIRSGLLMGIRTPVKTEDGMNDYIYNTYWISGINRFFQPVLSSKDIYLPRMDGFWKLKINKRMGTEGTEDVLIASMVSKRGDKLQSIIGENYSKRLETKLRSAVVYVGNDYVCVENTVLDSGESTTSAAFKKTIRTLPVDNLNNIDGIKISDIAGENGTMAMESAVSDLLKGSGNNETMLLDETTLQESFALYRKTGHWFFKGRLNLGSSNLLPYMDFNLNLIPPANMVAYDMLQVPWTTIKDRVPQAVDVYTSPNRDIAIVLTRSEILLYSINGKDLSAQPSFKLPLAEGSSVIMAEWAVGDYVQSWEKSFVKNNETSQVAEIKQFITRSTEEN
jgi:hypothetical protein